MRAAVVVLVLAVAFAIFLYNPIMAKNIPPDNHLVLLASRFLQGKIDLNPIGLPRGDVAAFLDKRFLYFGPFTSLIFVPFVWLFGQNFPQEVLGPVAMFVGFVSAVFLAKKFAFNLPDRFWLAIFFVFSTVVLAAGLIPISAYQVEILGTVLSLLMLLTYFRKDHPVLVGFFLALAGVTRFPLYLAFAFFILEFLYRRINFRTLVLIFVPVAISLLLIFAYNFRRFRNPFESGYSYNMTHQTYPLNVNLRYGLVNVAYLPSNLYVLFLKSPDPVLESGGGFLLKPPYLHASPWGFALWFSSPLFLYLLFRLKKDSQTLSFLLTAILVALPSLMFFSVGFAQFGYRYALDFLPFLYLALLTSLAPKLTLGPKILIVLGILLNFVLLVGY